MDYKEILEIHRKRKLVTEFYRGVRRGIIFGYLNRKKLNELRESIDGDEIEALEDYPLPKDGETQYDLV